MTDATCEEFGNALGAFPNFHSITPNEACIACGACDICTGELTETEEVMAT
jgi:hypothetical protein